MRRLILLGLILIPGSQMKAQYAGYTPVADVVKFRELFTGAAKITGSIKSDFVQEKNLSMLSEKIISKGKFWFKKDNRVRMEYNHPFQYLMIINNDKVFVKDAQKENKVSTRSNKLFQQINKVMVDCVQGTAFSNTDFKTRVFEGKSSYLVEMTPSAKGLKELFKTITVYVDKKDFTVNNLEMLELSGDHTTIRFINKELNTNLADALFDIK